MKASARASMIVVSVLLLAFTAIAAYSNRSPVDASRPSAAEDSGSVLAGLKPPPLEEVLRDELQTNGRETEEELLEEDVAAEEREIDGSVSAMLEGEREDGLNENSPEGSGGPMLLAGGQRYGHGTAGPETGDPYGTPPPACKNLDFGNPDNPQDLIITQRTCVQKGTYYYRFVTVQGKAGLLMFNDAQIDFWAKSILVADGGALWVGTAQYPITHNVVTFHLYGSEADLDAITCKTAYCGVPDNMWKDSHQRYPMPGLSDKDPYKDFFYAYKKLPADDALSEESYFGRKVIAVAYNGSLHMFGKKGTPLSLRPGAASRTSWVRLNRTAKAGTNTLTLDRPLDWQKNDWIVLTTTDYLPGHSELHQIADITLDGGKTVITTVKSLQYDHNGEKYDLKKHNLPDRLGLKRKSVETRAAVALLSRNIRIVSEGAGVKKPFPSPEDTGIDPKDLYFGGHTIARQGFRYFQMQGVELYQLGQGGRMAHSPVNFHLTRKTPPYTFVRDCSIWDSMNRWIDLRGTQNVDLSRNVGYLSIGHGYILSEGTEAHNYLISNIGIYARPAVSFKDGSQYPNVDGNPRKVPGIFGYRHASGAGLNDNDWLSFAGDYLHPSVFFITNGYNDFRGNMAVGAGACGACFWFVPAKMSGLSIDMTWDGNAEIQKTAPGAAQIKSFQGNFCSTAPYSIQTIGTTGVCDGVENPTVPSYPGGFQPIENPSSNSYLPTITAGGKILSNYCDDTPTKREPYPRCNADCNKGTTKNCAVNVIDSYTSSFHWAQQNYAAMWLRQSNFLVTDSALTDVLNGGLTMVSGGSYDQVLNRYWALTRKTVFIGNTQEGNQYASNAGPVSPGSTLTCSRTDPRFCRLVKRTDLTNFLEGTTFPLANFSVYQRLYNIYDGPVYEDSNAFLNIKRTEIGKTTPCKDGSCTEDWLFSQTVGILKGKDEGSKDKCVLPNCAIGWKQPNGFYYPPAFHSTNLYFDKVDIRHFVIVPLFKPGTTVVDGAKIIKQYCTYDKGDPRSLFSKDFTDVDRQTELNDDDGSLSGLKGADPPQFPLETSSTVSVNTDSFFYAPRQVLECVSEQTCIQSPYDFISAVVFPGHGAYSWSDDCTNRDCYGVPIYRQFLNQYQTSDGQNQHVYQEPKGDSQSIRMMGAKTNQRSTLIANHGTYYIDTTRSVTQQQQDAASINVFDPNATYNFFLLYAKETTDVVFQLYVGKGLKDDILNDFLANDVKMVRVGTNRRTETGSDDHDDITVLILPLKFTSQDWPHGWLKTYDTATGILTVRMVLGDFQDEFKKGKVESCGPLSYCKWDKAGDKCVDAGGSDEICRWSVKTYECPSEGCFGFQVKFPKTFTADNDPNHHRPEPFYVSSNPSFEEPGLVEGDPAKDAIAGDKSSWIVKWDLAKEDIAGDKNKGCLYDPHQPEDYNPFAPPQ